MYRGNNVDPPDEKKSMPFMLAFSPIGLLSNFVLFPGILRALASQPFGLRTPRRQLSGVPVETIQRTLFDSHITSLKKKCSPHLLFAS
jgi:hypothetical protein